ncbi:MAG: TonB-dependent receptor [Capnocytophaga sp.]|nr:TonB-dependent receptor [Capnocytophaga sp.]
MKKFFISVAFLSFIHLQAQEMYKEMDKDTIALEEVIISVNRIPEKKTNAVANVTVIDQKQLKEFIQIAPDLSQLIGMIEPALALSSNTTNNRYQTLRGRSMLVLIDGIPQSSPLRENSVRLRTIDPSAIERIEIIKGATAIYGNGSVGGVMNIVTKKIPTDVKIGGQTTIGASAHESLKEDNGFGYNLKQQFYGNYKGFSYLVDGALGQTGSAIDGEGLYISPRYGLGNIRSYNGLIKLGYEIDEDHKIEAMYNYFQSIQHSPLIASGGVYGVSPRIGIFGNKDPEEKPDGTYYAHNAYLKFTANKVFSHTDLEIDALTQHYKTMADYRRHNPRQPRWRSTSGQATIVGEKYGIRAQLTSKFLLSDNIVAYALYGADALIDRTGQPLVDGRIWVPMMTAYNSAPFLQAKVTFYNYWTLKAGVRYDYIDVSIPTFEALRNRDTDPITIVEGDNLLYKNLSPNIGLAYNQYKYFQPYLSYAQGFSIYDLGRTVRSATSYDALKGKINTDPAVVDNYEVGFYSDINKYVQLSGSYFYTTSELGSELELDSATGFWVVSKDPQRIYGFELALDIHPTEWLTFGGSYISYEGKKKPQGSDSFDTYMNSSSIVAPKATAYVNVRPNRKSFVRLNYLHSGVRDRFAPNPSTGRYNEGQGPIRPIDLFSLSAGYSFNKNLSLGLGVENLMNKVYYTTASMLVARDAEYARGNGRYISLNLTFKY